MGKQYKKFEETDIWQQAHKMVLDIYEASKRFPKEEMYNLTSQIRRAVLSLTGNIAEAFGRYHYRDKLNFYYNVRGSMEETKSHLLAARDLKYMPEITYNALRVQSESISESINKIINTLRAKIEIS